MKCHYFLAPTLDLTSAINDDLHAIGIKDWYVHVISKDEAGLKREKIHSSNYLETLDALAGGVMGAIIGLIIGVLIALVLMVAQPLGSQLSSLVYAIVVLAPAGFGLWEGALLRAKYDNKKVAPFHDDIDAGKYLILVYTPKDKSDDVQDMMRTRYPQAKHVAVDEHFADPLRAVDRE